MKVTVEALVKAPLDHVWHCWTSPEHIMQWNAASDDWHTTKAHVDLRPGGAFSSRMEAKDGSMGFDFAGTYVRIDPHALISAQFGDREMEVTFAAQADGILVREVFDAETEHPVEMQKSGWQAILDNFKRHTEAQV